MSPILGMIMDFIWFVASAVFWALYFIDANSKSDTEKKQTKRITIMIICAVVGILSFIFGFAATMPENQPYPLYDIIDFVTMAAFVLFFFTISGTKWATICIISLVVTFASAFGAVMLRTFVIYAPLLKGFF